MNARPRKWLPEARILLCLAVLVTLIFAVTPLDLFAARVFYRSQGLDHWPLGTVWLATFLYKLAPVITASVLAASLVGLIIGQFRGYESWRRNCIFLIFSMLIGPGLLVNAIFKDHWQRPRPRDVVEFGGSLHYTPPPWPGEGGSSFPCGHCSVGFLYATGWWMWRRKRRGLARSSLVLGLALGAALGIGRMAAGAHFLSDVIWSALIALGVAHLVYEHMLPLTDLAAGKTRLTATRMLTLGAFFGAALALMALFVTPHGKPFSLHLDPASLPEAPMVLEIIARKANVDLVVEDSADLTQIIAEGELHGFALPRGQLQTSMSFQASPISTVSFRVEERGWITDLSAFATIRVPLGKLQRIVVRLHEGSIHVTDATRERAIDRGILKLDLGTHSGAAQLR